MSKDLIRSALLEELNKREYSRENQDFKRLVEQQPTAFDVDETVEELKAAIPLNGTLFEQGFHAALDEVKQYGRPVEHVVVT